MDFEEIVAAMESNGTDCTDLRTAYTDAISIREAAISERDTAIAGHTEAMESLTATHAGEIESRDKEITRVKAANYDLLKATPVDDPDNVPGEPEPEAFVSGIDSLFGKG